MTGAYKLDKTGSRCRDVWSGKYAKYALCRTKKVVK